MWRFSIITPNGKQWLLRNVCPFVFEWDQHPHRAVISAPAQTESAILHLRAHTVLQPNSEWNVSTGRARKKWHSFNRLRGKHVNCQLTAELKGKKRRPCDWACVGLTSAEGDVKTFSDLCPFAQWSVVFTPVIRAVAHMSKPRTKHFLPTTQQAATLNLCCH